MEGYIFDRPSFLLPTFHPSTFHPHKMKNYILLFMAFGVLTISACGTEKSSNAKQDSLEANAAADSMLREALKADSAKADSGSM